MAWLTEHGWKPLPDRDGLWRSTNLRHLVVRGEHPGELADAVHAAAFHVERPGLDVLDEMAETELAAMEAAQA